MKQFLSICLVFCLGVMLGVADGTKTGALTVTQLSTLAGAASTNSLYGDTNALAYANRRGITDNGAKNDLTQFVLDCQKSGIPFNQLWADCAILHTWLNPNTNYQSWKGTPLQVAAPAFTDWGALIDGTSNTVWNLPLQCTSPSNTVVIVWRGTPTNYYANGESLFGAYDTNQNSRIYAQFTQYACYLYSMSNSVSIPSVYLNSGSTWLQTLYDITAGGNFGASGGNFNNGGYNNPMPVNNYNPFIKTSFFSGDGAGNYTYWINGSAGAIGNTNRSGIPFYAGGYTTNLWNALMIGATPTNADYNLGLVGHANPFAGEIAFAGILNVPMTPALARIIDQALVNLHNTHSMHIIVCDSRAAIVADSISKNVSGWEPFEFVVQNPKYHNDLWYDYGISGLKARQWDTVTNLTFYRVPHGKITKTDVWDDLGFNDIWNDVGTVAGFWGSVTNEVNWYHNLGISVKKLVGFPLSTNCVGGVNAVFSYNSTYITQLALYRSMLLTNRTMFDGVCDPWPWMTQNLLNTNSGFSADGIHFNPSNVYTGVTATNGWMVNRWLAYLYMQGDTPAAIDELAPMSGTTITSSNSSVAISITPNGNSGGFNYDLSASGGGGSIPNGLVTNSAPASIVVTNAGVATTITSNSVTTGTVTATNFAGNGAGLTNLTYVSFLTNDFLVYSNFYAPTTTNSPLTVTVPAGIWRLTADAFSQQLGVAQYTQAGITMSPSAAFIYDQCFYFNSPSSVNGYAAGDGNGGYNYLSTIGPYGNFVCAASGAWQFNGTIVTTNAATTITVVFNFTGATTNSFKVWHGAILRMAR